MIHHISIAVNNPLHVSHVLAELLQGQATPFPSHPGSYVALALDTQGTMNELPRRKRTGYQNQKRLNCSSRCNFK